MASTEQFNQKKNQEVERNLAEAFTAEKPKKRNAGKAKAQRLMGLKKLEKSRNIQRKTEE